MRRREFITFLASGVVAWPLAARAQQPAMPFIGFLDSRPSDAMTERLRAFRQGLKDTGYVEGENVTIVYRFAENQVDRLPELAADLVRRQVAVIATGVPLGAFAAKAATATIPTVFLVAEDPVRLGLEGPPGAPRRTSAPPSVRRVRVWRAAKARWNALSSARRIRRQIINSFPRERPRNQVNLPAQQMTYY
jgi:hypothetical protein